MPETLEFFEQRPPSPERRFHARETTRAIAYVQLDEGNGGIVLNISEGGLAVRAVASVMDEALPRIRFQLPESSVWIEASARVAWTSESRKMAGLRFSDLPEHARSQILEWCFSQAWSGKLAAQTHAAVPVAGENGNVDASPPQNSSAVPAAPVVVPAAPAATIEGLASLAGDHARRKHSAGKARRQLAHPQFLPPEPNHTKRNLAILGVLLAALSLVAGWAAGRGTLRPLLHQVAGAIAKEVAKLAPNLSAQAGPPSPTPAAPTGADAVTSADAPVVAGPGAPLDDSSPSPLDAGPSGGQTTASNTQQSVNMPAMAVAPAPAPREDSPAPMDQPAPSQRGSANAIFDLSVLPNPIQPRNTLPVAGSRAPEPPAVAGQDSARSVLPLPVPSDAILNLAPPKPVAAPDPPSETAHPLRLIHRVEPKYPIAAEESRIEGTVRLHATIDARGAVVRLEPLSGPPALIPAARDAVRKWRYQPARLDGRRVPSEADISVEFHLPSSQ
jgi:periplasmic protein TonB